jgi:hypothetical protein
MTSSAVCQEAVQRLNSAFLALQSWQGLLGSAALSRLVALHSHRDVSKEGKHGLARQYRSEWGSSDSAGNASVGQVLI